MSLHDRYVVRNIALGFPGWQPLIVEQDHDLRRRGARGMTRMTG